jgi:hypothetical protein
MTREEYNHLPSNGREACPDCGLCRTTPCGGCHCPPSPGGYGTQHINLYHHNCADARKQEAEAQR